MAFCSATIIPLQQDSIRFKGKSTLNANIYRPITGAKLGTHSTLVTTLENPSNDYRAHKLIPHLSNLD